MFRPPMPIPCGCSSGTFMKHRLSAASTFTGDVDQEARACSASSLVQECSAKLAGDLCDRLAPPISEHNVGPFVATLIRNPVVGEVKVTKGPLPSVGAIPATTFAPPGDGFFFLVRGGLVYSAVRTGFDCRRLLQSRPACWSPVRRRPCDQRNCSRSTRSQRAHLALQSPPRWSPLTLLSKELTASLRSAEGGDPANLVGSEMVSTTI